MRVHKRTVRPSLSLFIIKRTSDAYTGVGRRAVEVLENDCIKIGRAYGGADAIDRPPARSRKASAGNKKARL